MTPYLPDPRSAEHLATLLPAAQRLGRSLLSLANDGRFGPRIVVKIIAGFRSYAEQNALYAQGRTTPGNIVTQAPAGYSWHNFAIAFDLGVFRDDAYLDDSPLYAQIGRLGQSLGLVWGGSWTQFPDEPHFQIATPYSLADARRLHAEGKWETLFA